MRTVVHLSDIHFGRTAADVIEPLYEAVRALAPDLVAVSGDLTQRARRREFEAARLFLDALPGPRIVVPGNHDVPLHDVVARFFGPLDRYRRYITSDLEPLFEDEELLVLGLNTARSLTIKGGRINDAQLARMREVFCGRGGDRTKVIVTHHPFDLPARHDVRDLVGRAEGAMRAFAQCGVDMLLAGHMHLSHAGHTAERWRIDRYAALFVQAGTATSTRARGEANSFNVILVDRPEITVKRYVFRPDAGAFVPEHADRFRRGDHGWSLAAHAAGRPA
ncbi:MAG: metallophosphoesterase [Minicystis sp.]